LFVTLKPLGPLQSYRVALVADPEKFMVPPRHTFGTVVFVAEALAVAAPGTVVVETATVRAVPLSQVFDGVTCTFPDADPTVTVTELVVPPAV
jgi:hypothetical protein